MSEELEMIKLVAMIIAIVAFLNFPLILKRRKDFNKYLPGITCLIMLFASSFLEDAFRVFEILKNIFVLAGAILLFIAARMEYREIQLNKYNDNYPIVHSNNNKVGETNV